MDESSYNEFERIDIEFNDKLFEFYNHLKDITKFTTSQYLYHITKRMEGCLNPMRGTVQN